MEPVFLEKKARSKGPGAGRESKEGLQQVFGEGRQVGGRWGNLTWKVPTTHRGKGSERLLPCPGLFTRLFSLGPSKAERF